MTTGKLFGYGGMAVFLGGALWALQRIGWTVLIGDRDPLSYPQPTATILWLVGLVVSILILLGLPALYVRQAPQSGRFGLIAFVLVFSGMALVAGNAYFGAFIQAGLAELIDSAQAAGILVEEPAMAAVGFLAALALQIIGWLAFGLITFTAGVLPRWAAVLVMIGNPISLAMIMGLGLLWWQVPLFEVGLAALGLGLWREQRRAAFTELAPAA